MDLDWSQTFPRSEVPLDQAFNPFNGWSTFEALSDDEKLRFGWHNLAWMLAQFMHGEQGALLVASQQLRAVLRCQTLCGQPDL